MPVPFGRPKSDLPVALRLFDPEQAEKACVEELTKTGETRSRSRKQLGVEVDEQTRDITVSRFRQCRTRSKAHE
ncbi:hypothetical protein RHSP_83510 [Rhizobium freirei PRF 81]|uniref:Uncharacterized protein n=2 Tax=Rhizobium TaxID=379 RepID=N6V5C3_9HYPH|nr:hypothetical protein RTCIAT899_PB00980 [Rhizobium tropici CIAT 899]AYG70402.1 hypothetical protein CCGE531_30640 [Rhizobium sp. CCGE531]ENN88351.1 hypothetical protein RHSP_83510 [Rhizobium freirei PRF 81]NEV13952.1 hypothetical protein [Rhizobium tropici]TGE92770.1 hypothetical protein C9417_27875 [Rhizobium sp. SEMIA 4088]